MMSMRVFLLLALVVAFARCAVQDAVNHSQAGERVGCGEDNVAFFRDREQWAAQALSALVQAHETERVIKAYHGLVAPLLLEVQFPDGTDGEERRLKFSEQHDKTEELSLQERWATLTSAPASQFSYRMGVSRPPAEDVGAPEEVEYVLSVYLSSNSEMPETEVALNFTSHDNFRYTDTGIAQSASSVFQLESYEVSRDVRVSLEKTEMNLNAHQLQHAYLSLSSPTLLDSMMPSELISTSWGTFYVKDSIDRQGDSINFQPNSPIITTAIGEVSYYFQDIPRQYNTDEEKGLALDVAYIRRVVADLDAPEHPLFKSFVVALEEPAQHE